MPEGVKREGEAQEGPQLLTGIAKLGKRSTFLLLGQQATQATDEPQRRPLCVFDYKIKLRCGRKLAVPGTVQQTIAYCPTLYIWAHTHTHSCGATAAANNCSAHIIWLKGFVLLANAANVGLLCT